MCNPKIKKTITKVKQRTRSPRKQGWLSVNKLNFRPQRKRPESFGEKVSQIPQTTQKLSITNIVENRKTDKRDRDLITEN